MPSSANDGVGVGPDDASPDAVAVSVYYEDHGYCGFDGNASGGLRLPSPPAVVVDPVGLALKPSPVPAAVGTGGTLPADATATTAPPTAAMALLPHGVRQQ